ncbi:MAG: SDR family NAD(P)-dependent oxidoreductase [Chlorobi bacterium]|nr:SDR family NAD(P)-dependent oxidoreductase [Chlorobiota bacterium]
MKNAIVIGASSGIGKELALILAENGCKTIITGRRKEKLEELKRLNPDNFIVKSFDITTEDGNKELSEITEKTEKLDLLVLSAGTGDINEKLDYETENRINLLNVIAFTNVMNRFYKFFEKQGYGHITVISSIAGLRGNRYTPAYNASKAYQINYLEGLRQKAVKSGKKIFITDVRPGFVDTEMAKGDKLFWVSPPQKAARQIFRAIKNKKDVAYITKRWRLIATILKIMPGFLYKRL